MEFLSVFSLFIHIAAGVLTLLAGPVAIFYNFRDPRKHRLAGKIFFYAMLVVCGSSVAGYLKRPDQVFFQFLLGIAVLVLANVLRGVRAVRIMKGGTVSGFDFTYMISMGLAGSWMLGMAVWHFFQGTMIAFPVLFGVFGLATTLDFATGLRCFLHPERLHRLDWYRMHVGAMLGAFTASTTAFTVNAAPFLPWYLQWFGPTLLILPLQIYFGRMLQRQKRAAGHAQAVSV